MGWPLGPERVKNGGFEATDTQFVADDAAAEPGTKYLYVETTRPPGWLVVNGPIKWLNDENTRWHSQLRPFEGHCFLDLTGKAMGKDVGVQRHGGIGQR